MRYEDSLDLDWNPARIPQLGLIRASILVGGPQLKGCGRQPGIGWESCQVPPLKLISSSILVGGPQLTGCGGQPGIGWELCQVPPVGVNEFFNSGGSIPADRVWWTDWNWMGIMPSSFSWG